MWRTLGLPIVIINSNHILGNLEIVNLYIVYLLLHELYAANLSYFLCALVLLLIIIFICFVLLFYDAEYLEVHLNLYLPLSPRD